MPDIFKDRADRRTVSIVPLQRAALDGWLKDQPASVASWVKASGFTAAVGSTCLVPDGDGASLARVLFGVSGEDDPLAYGGLVTSLPEGSYRIEGTLSPAAATAAATGWALGAYRFDRYKTGKEKPKPFPTLVWPAGADRDYVRALAEATTMVRDLINTPTADMGPADLAAAARKVGRAHGARVSVIVGDDLLKRNYPTVHAVGRACANPPRLIDLTWGEAGAPKVTLVGKGVCFDTGGLDLKTAAGMLRMKKDMGGAANVLGVADMIMRLKLPVRLRVLIPAVENSVSGDSYHPLDVIKTRKGITVEIGNTDAEGRLVLCDALAEAASEKPALIVDMATLTGAARVALGAELAALFCNDDATASALEASAAATSDPVWRMPLWKPYRKLIDSKVADVNNVSEGTQGGAITAALYLQEFVEPDIPWIHLDIMAWNASDRPGRPTGGETQGMRALFHMINARFAK